MNKLVKSTTFNYLVALLIFLLISGCFSGRHITKLVKTPISTADTIKAVDDFNQVDIVKMESLLKIAKERAQKSEFIDNINETIYLLIGNKVGFTVIIKGQSIVVERGIIKGISPTLLIPFSTSVAENLVGTLEDYKLDEHETFNVCYVIFMSCLNRMYSMPYLYETSMYKGRLDDFLQFKIKNPKGYTYHGKAVEISGTVVNVDGMFITIPGLVGDPDIRLELTLEQAINLYTYVVYDAVKQQSVSDKMKLFKKYSTLINDSKVYERSWH